MKNTENVVFLRFVILKFAEGFIRVFVKKLFKNVLQVASVRADILALMENALESARCCHKSHEFIEH